MNAETKLPKLPKGWKYDRVENCDDGSGGPWIEVNGPGGDWVCLDRHTDDNVLKWGTVSIFLYGGDDPYSLKDLQRVVARVKTLRSIASKMAAWARSENRRPHEIEYAGRKRRDP